MDRPTIVIEDPDQPEILAMFAAADAYYAALYPAESNHLLEVAALKRPEVAFYVARVAGRAKGFGSVVRQGGGYGEIKRMYVDPAARGHRLGRMILETLEASARRDGIRHLRLETGVRQAEALALYRAAGYRETGPFGDYHADPLSVFMTKQLDQ